MAKDRNKGEQKTDTSQNNMYMNEPAFVGQ